jgi:hypothetical protein
MDGFVDVKINISMSFRVLRTNTYMSKLRSITSFYPYRWFDVLKLIPNYSVFRYNVSTSDTELDEEEKIKSITINIDNYVVSSKTDSKGN